MSFSLVNLKSPHGKPKLINLDTKSETTTRSYSNTEISSGIKIVKHSQHESYVYWHIVNNRISLNEESFGDNLAGSSLCLDYPEEIVPSTVIFSRFDGDTSDIFALISASVEKGYVVLFSVESEGQSIFNSRPAFYSVDFKREDLFGCVPICSALGGNSKHVYFASTSTLTNRIHLLIVPIMASSNKSGFKSLSDAIKIGVSFYVDLTLSTTYFRKLSAFVISDNQRLGSYACVFFEFDERDYVAALNEYQVEIWECKTGRSARVCNLLPLLNENAQNFVNSNDNFLMKATTLNGTSLEVVVQMCLNSKFSVFVFAVNKESRFNITFVRKIGEYSNPCLSVVLTLSYYGLLFGSGEKRSIQLVSRDNDRIYYVPPLSQSAHSDLIVDVFRENTEDLCSLALYSLRRSLKSFSADVIHRALRLEVECGRIPMQVPNLNELDFEQLTDLCSVLIYSKVKAHGIEKGNEDLYLVDTKFADVKAFYSTCLLCKQKNDVILAFGCLGDSDNLLMVSKTDLIVLSKDGVEENCLTTHLPTSLIGGELFMTDEFVSQSFLEALRLLDSSVVNNMGAANYDNLVFDVVRDCLQSNYSTSINHFNRSTSNHISVEDFSLLNNILSNIDSSQLTTFIDYICNQNGEPRGDESVECNEYDDGMVVEDETSCADVIDNGSESVLNVDVCAETPNEEDLNSQSDWVPPTRLGWELITNYVTLHFASRRRILRTVFTVCAWTWKLETLDSLCKIGFLRHILQFYLMDRTLGVLYPRNPPNAAKQRENVLSVYYDTRLDSLNIPVISDERLCRTPCFLEEGLVGTSKIPHSVAYDFSAFSHFMNVFLDYRDNHFSTLFGFLLFENGYIEPLINYTKVLRESHFDVPPGLSLVTCLSHLTLNIEDPDLVKKLKSLSSPRSLNELSLYFNFVDSSVYNSMIVNAAFVVGRFDLVIELCENVLDVDLSGDSITPLLYESHLVLGHFYSAYLLLSSMALNDVESFLEDFLYCIEKRGQCEVIQTLPWTCLSLKLFELMNSRLCGLEASRLFSMTLIVTCYGRRFFQYQKVAAVAYRSSRELLKMEAEYLEESLHLIDEALEALDNLPECDQFVILEDSTPEENLDIVAVNRGFSEISPAGDCSVSSMTFVSREQIYVDKLIVRARTVLLSNEPSVTFDVGNRDSLFGALCGVGMYDEAFYLSRYYNRPNDGIVVSLVERCLGADSVVEMSSDSYLQVSRWLLQIPFFDSMETTNYVECCWNVLKSFLTKYDDRESLGMHHVTILHIVAATRKVPPVWLEDQFMSVSPVALLRIYIDYELYSRAAELVIDMCRAFIGVGDYPVKFGVKNCLLFNDSESCFPYSTVEQLLSIIINLNEENELSDSLMTKLSDGLINYMDCVEKTSFDMQYYRKNKFKRDLS